MTDGSPCLAPNVVTVGDVDALAAVHLAYVLMAGGMLSRFDLPVHGVKFGFGIEPKNSADIPQKTGSPSAILRPLNLASKADAGSSGEPGSM